VDAIVAFAGGVITAFYNPSTHKPWGIYVSAGGASLGGGGGTKRVYSGDARVDAMVPFKNGVIAAMYNPDTGNAWGIYSSPDGLQFPGNRVYPTDVAI
jgi:hypothetical protein